MALSQPLYTCLSLQLVTNAERMELFYLWISPHCSCKNHVYLSLDKTTYCRLKRNQHDKG